MTKSKKGKRRTFPAHVPFTVSKYTAARPPSRPALYSSSCLTSFWSMSLLSLPEGWSLGMPGTGGRAWFMHHCFLWMNPKVEWTQALCVWHNGLWQQLETYRLSGTEQTLNKRQLEGDWGKGDNCTGEWIYVLYIFLKISSIATSAICIFYYAVTH